MSWQPWVTEVAIKDAPGGRRGLGSANHCMHGKDAVIEEILDWRPYDYVTDLTILDTPAGPVKLPHTIEFEPTPTGTIIHMRFAAPKNKRQQGPRCRHRGGLRRSTPVQRPEPARATGRRACGTQGGPRPGAGSGGAEGGRAALGAQPLVIVG